ncbi:hypothetical protein BDV06DRAFT_235615 [Aspergillus oleicola]
MPNPVKDLLVVDQDSFSYIYEQNHSVKLQSNPGLVRLNVYRPKSIAKSPVLVTYGPYRKDIPYKDFLPHSWHDLNPAHTSEHSGFEVPDPAFWTNEGYAVVRADEIGLGQSPGVCDTMSKSTSEAFHEVIEWAADQPWSSGEIGLLGISYFAGTQWRVAARRPRGLAAIIPYEGMADYYRNRCRHGGILTAPFLKFWMDHQVKSNLYRLPGKAARNWGPDTLEGDLSEEIQANLRDQTVENAQNAFRNDEYYASREYCLEDIEVPLLSVGNWGNIVVHLRGNIEGFVHAGSQHKFLWMIVGRHDLPFYSDEEVKLQKSFLSAFLKGDDYAGWTAGKMPKADLILRKGQIKFNDLAAATGQVYSRRAENEWPLARTLYKKYYLNPEKTWTVDEPHLAHHTRLSYRALTVPDDNEYIRFETAPAAQELEITGHIMARVHVSVTADLGGPVPKDIDIFLTIRHWAADRQEIFYTGSIGNPVPVSKGWQRVSLRKINQGHPYHRKYQPYQDYFSTDVQPVIPGEIYTVDVEIWPTNIILLPGEKLSFEIGGGDTQGVGIFSHESPERSRERFGGMNHIHFGPDHLNFVVLPVIPQE